MHLNFSVVTFAQSSLISSSSPALYLVHQNTSRNKQSDTRTFYMPVFSNY